MILPFPRSAISSLPVNATPGGSAGSPKAAPARRLAAGRGVAVGAGGAGVAIEDGCADGVTLGVGRTPAAGEQAVNNTTKAASGQRVLGVRVVR
jgi:hypothetical protein